MSKAEKRKLWIAFGITAWIVLMYLVVFPARFEQNDDTAMAQIAYGANGQYDAHLIFINILVGYLLKALLALVPTLPWYTIVQCTVVALSFGTIIYLILKRFHMPVSLAFIAVLLFYFGSDYFSLLQFTKTAGIASLAGMLLLFDRAAAYSKDEKIREISEGASYVPAASSSAGQAGGASACQEKGAVCQAESSSARQAEGTDGQAKGAAAVISGRPSDAEDPKALQASARGKKRFKAIPLILGLVLAFTGALYRFKAFEMILVPMFGIGVYFALKAIKGKEKKFFFQLAIPFVILLAASFGANAYNSHIYNSDPAWAEYMEYNNLRSDLLDFGFPDYDQNKELYDSLGISEYDLKVYQDWNFDDPDRFTIDTMQKLVDAKKATHHTFHLGDIKLFFTYLVSPFLNYSFFSAMLLVIVLAFFFYRTGMLWLLLYELFSFGIMELYLFESGRYMVQRVDVSLALAFFLVFLLYGLDIRYRGAKKLAVAMSMLVAVVPPLVSLELKIDPNQTAAKLEKDSFATMASDKDHLYLYSSGAFSENSNSIWTMYHLGDRSNIACLGGWTTHSSIREYVLQNYGVTNSFRDMIDHDNVYVVEFEKSKEEFARYLQDHYGKDVKAYRVKTINGTQAVYEFRTTPPEVDQSRVTENTEGLFTDITYHKENQSYDGTIYMPGVNSFACTLYAGITDPDTGKEDYQVVSLGINDKQPDLDNGKYSNFSLSTKKIKKGSVISLYLDTGGQVYKVPLGQ